jgi:hypothetical protein
MFKKKYNISMIDSKWIPIKRNVKINIIPRRDEFIWIDEKYYQVINVVHSITDKHEVLLVVEEQNNNSPIIE